ncbi:MAG: hypothetical protein K0S38_92 [Candidatus Paceibacter sp.]|nr:hypothetical protein [Candidatus Paceibacter sp.]
MILDEVAVQLRPSLNRLDLAFSSQELDPKITIQVAFIERDPTPRVGLLHEVLDRFEGGRDCMNENAADEVEHSVDPKIFFHDCSSFVKGWQQAPPNFSYILYHN